MTGLYNGGKKNRKRTKERTVEKQKKESKRKRRPLRTPFPSDHIMKLQASLITFAAVPRIDLSI